MRSLPLLAVALLTACALPVRHARTSFDAARTPDEDDALVRYRSSRCDPAVGLLFPGIAQHCLGYKTEGTAMAALGAIELGTGVPLAIFAPEPADPDLFRHGGRWVNLLMFTDLYVYSATDARFVERRAAAQRFVPLDTPGELVAAPFNIHVLKRPTFWVSTPLLVAGAFGLGALIDDPTAPALGATPNLYGLQPPSAVGVPVGLGLHGALMVHVAVAEEAVFRGDIQSTLAHRWDNEGLAWLAGSAIFGGLHATNLIVIPPEDQLDYAVYGLPYITLTGSWLGAAYRIEGYTLTTPVAIHFWYNVALSATGFVLNPEESVFAFRIGGSL